MEKYITDSKDSTRRFCQQPSYRSISVEEWYWRSNLTVVYLFLFVFSCFVEENQKFHHVGCSSFEFMAYACKYATLNVTASNRTTQIGRRGHSIWLSCLVKITSSKNVSGALSDSIHSSFVPRPQLPEEVCMSRDFAVNSTEKKFYPNCIDRSMKGLRFYLSWKNVKICVCVQVDYWHSVFSSK